MLPDCGWLPGVGKDTAKQLGVTFAVEGSERVQCGNALPLGRLAGVDNRDDAALHFLVAEGRHKVEPGLHLAGVARIKKAAGDVDGPGTSVLVELRSALARAEFDRADQ